MTISFTGHPVSKGLRECSRHEPYVVVSVSGHRFDRRMGYKRSYGGRPHKGERDAMMIRPAQELGELVRQAAEDAEMTITDYVTEILAHELGRPDLTPSVTSVRTGQKELPLAASA